MPDCHWPEVRIALLDGGVGPALAPACAALLDVDADGALRPARAGPDAGHGSEMLRLLLHEAPSASIHVIRVLDDEGRASAGRLLAALRAVVALQPDLVSLSLGLNGDRRALREAVQTLVEGGALLCASAPARGATVYPAGYAGVLAVSGDARCAVDEHSHIDSRGVDFGASVLDSHGRPGGASFAVPRICGRIARYLLGGGHKSGVYGHLSATAAYRGREQRRVPA